jgi:hypothetical protein
MTGPAAKAGTAERQPAGSNATETAGGILGP